VSAENWDWSLRVFGHDYAPGYYAAYLFDPDLR
jgi:hypothetical protein